jgi:GNAT superfamily N-acetyltransferase
MIEYKEESYDNVIGEIKPLLDLHYEEIANNKDVIKLNPDYAMYKKLCDAGVMRIITARDDSKLIGYCICLIKYHLHYKDSLTALNDIFYISKDYRKGLIGVKLFIKTEEILKKYGVQRVIMNTKMHHDVGAIFDRLGYKETERVFTKIIG